VVVTELVYIDEVFVKVAGNAPRCFRGNAGTVVEPRVGPEIVPCSVACNAGSYSARFDSARFDSERFDNGDLDRVQRFRGNVGDVVEIGVARDARSYRVLRRQ
jgi:hypothetical protein